MEANERKYDSSNVQRKVKETTEIAREQQMLMKNLLLTPNRNWKDLNDQNEENELPENFYIQNYYRTRFFKYMSKILNENNLKDEKRQDQANYLLNYLG